jgi:hypothetical protein
VDVQHRRGRRCQGAWRKCRQGSTAVSLFCFLCTVSTRLAPPCIFLLCSFPAHPLNKPCPSLPSPVLPFSVLLFLSKVPGAKAEVQQAIQGANQTLTALACAPSQQTLPPPCSAVFLSGAWCGGGGTTGRTGSKLNPHRTALCTLLTTLPLPVVSCCAVSCSANSSLGSWRKGGGTTGSTGRTGCQP